MLHTMYVMLTVCSPVYAVNIVFTTAQMNGYGLRHTGLPGDLSIIFTLSA